MKEDLSFVVTPLYLYDRKLLANPWHFPPRYGATNIISNFSIKYFNFIGSLIHFILKASHPLPRRNHFFIFYSWRLGWYAQPGNVRHQAAVLPYRAVVALALFLYRAHFLEMSWFVLPVPGLWGGPSTRAKIFFGDSSPSAKGTCRLKGPTSPIRPRSPARSCSTK